MQENLIKLHSIILDGDLTEAAKLCDELIAAQQRAMQPDVRACIRAELDNWHIETGDLSHYEALADSLVSALAAQAKQGGV